MNPLVVEHSKDIACETAYYRNPCLVAGARTLSIDPNHNSRPTSPLRFNSHESGFRWALRSLAAHFIANSRMDTEEALLTWGNIYNVPFEAVDTASIYMLMGCPISIEACLSSAFTACQVIAEHLDEDFVCDAVAVADFLGLQFGLDQ